MKAKDPEYEGATPEGEETAIFPIDGERGSGPTTEMISDALMRQARQLISLAVNLHPDQSSIDSTDPEFIGPVAPSPGMFFQNERAIELDTRDMAETVYRLRRLRDTVFNDPELFGEPAWDILLDLAHARASGIRISVSSACVGACVPSTTALRWLSILEKKGLVEREDDLLDGRRTYVRLSRKGLSKMEDYLRASRGM